MRSCAFERRKTGDRSANKTVRFPVKRKSFPVNKEIICIVFNEDYNAIIDNNTDYLLGFAGIRLSELKCYKKLFLLEWKTLKGNKFYVSAKMVVSEKGKRRSDGNNYKRTRNSSHAERLKS